MKFAQHVRSLALWERVGERERSGARRHFIVRGGSARPMIVRRGRAAGVNCYLPVFRWPEPEDPLSDVTIGNIAMATHSYETDFIQWTQEQSALLRAGKWAQLDYANIAEELEEMGKEQKLALQSLLRQILVHLLKLEHSPAAAPKIKWTEEVIEFRDQAQSRIDATPSLKHHAPELFDKAWQQARRAAAKAFALYNEEVSLPERCPYSLEQVLDPDYLPG